MYITVNGQEVLLDTLYTGCTVGSYSAYSEHKQNFTCKVKYSGLSLVLSSEKLYRYAEKYNSELMKKIKEIENEVKQNGVPVVDYTLYRKYEMT